MGGQGTGPGQGGAKATHLAGERILGRAYEAVRSLANLLFDLIGLVDAEGLIFHPVFCMLP